MIGAGGEHGAEACGAAAVAVGGVEVQAAVAGGRAVEVFLQAAAILAEEEREAVGNYEAEGVH